MRMLCRPSLLVRQLRTYQRCGFHSTAWQALRRGRGGRNVQYVEPTRVAEPKESTESTPTPGGIKHFEVEDLNSKSPVEVDPEENEAQLDSKLDEIRGAWEGFRQNDGEFEKEAAEAMDLVAKIEADPEKYAKEIKDELGTDDFDVDDVFEENEKSMKGEEPSFQAMKDHVNDKVEEITAMSGQNLYPDKYDPSDEIEGLLTFPAETDAKVANFNDSVRHLIVSEGRNLKWLNTVWHWYLKSKNAHPGFIENIQSEIWDFLYSSSKLTKDERIRNQRLRTLVDDMDAAGQPLAAEQAMFWLEYKTHEGKVTDALEVWRDAREELWSDPDVKVAFQDLGVQLIAQTGESLEAEQLSFEILNKIRKQDTGRLKLLIHVMHAWAARGTAIDQQRAFMLYLYFRYWYGDKITHEDYDRIYLGFLDAKQTSLALVVFKDLVLAARKSKVNDSVELFQPLMQEVRKLGTGHEDTIVKLMRFTDDILRHTAQIVRKQVRNKYFYASWMKRLIGIGEIAHAASIIEMMHEQSVRPDAMHINGIIGAWLRRGLPQDEGLALRLAEDMIKVRLELVNGRPTRPESENEPSQWSAQDRITTPWEKEALPAATAETFTILVIHYTQMRSFNQVQKLYEVQKYAQVPMNSILLNSLLYAEYYSKGAPETWALFVKLSKRTQPDTDTFACLWQCSNRVARHFHTTDVFPGPRKMFEHMMHWLQGLPYKERKEQVKSFTSELHDLVIGAFVTTRDLEGTIVALYGMRDAFGVYPRRSTTLLIASLIARLREGQIARPRAGMRRMQRRKKPIRPNDADPEALKQVFKALSILGAQRTDELQSRGIDGEKLTDHEKDEELLNLLVQLLKATVREVAAHKAEKYKNTEDLDLTERIDQLAFKMACGPFSTGPPVYDWKAQ